MFPVTYFIRYALGKFYGHVTVQFSEEKCTNLCIMSRGTCGSGDVVVW